MFSARQSVRFFLRVLLSLVIECVGCFYTHAAAPDNPPLHNHPEVAQFIDEMVTEHRFSRKELQHWFRQARLQPRVLKAMVTPATARPWYQFRTTYVSEGRIRGGLEFWERYKDTLARASTEYGLPAEIIVATLGVESFYGRNMGTFPVFDSLATLAFAYPPRAAMFRDELRQLLLLSRELRTTPLQHKGSFAGAVGLPQFLASSYRKYAVDFDNDGKRDLWNVSDAIGSIAHYYKSYGWQPGERVMVALEEPVEPTSDEFKVLLGRGIQPHTQVAAIRRTGVTPAEYVVDDALATVFAAETEAGMRYWLGFNNFYVITRYNRSVNYALAIYELAQELKRTRGGR